MEEQEEWEEIWKRAWIRWRVRRIWEERRLRIQNRQRNFPGQWNASFFERLVWSLTSSEV